MQPKLWDHQQKAFDIAKDKSRFAIFFDIGCGKTATMIHILRYRYAKAMSLLPTLILSPLITLNNWKREFGIHSDLENSCEILKGTKRKRMNAITSSSKKIFITNYESLLMKDLYQEFIKKDFKILVLDESHYCKNIQAQRTKLAIKLADNIFNKFLLTGTPILNSPMDIFSQYRILDGGATFGENFYVFRKDYFEDKNRFMPSNRHFPNWQMQKGKDEEINRLIYKKAMRVLKQDCLDLPPLVYQRIDIELSVEQARHYKSMKQDFIAWIEESETHAPIATIAQMAVTKAIRLQQIVCGFVKTVDGKEVDYKVNPRLRALKELLETIATKHKIIIWACFRKNYAQIEGMLRKEKITYVTLYGEMTERQKNESIDRFRSEKGISVMVANPRVGGIGVNLTEADIAIYYSRNFSLEDRLQSEGRNYRGGSNIHQKVTIIDIVAPGTIDELVLKALKKKEKMTESILKWRYEL